MSGIEVVLSRLERVRRSGTGQWMARCPAHQDKGPSLSIADRDGKILLYCHAQCSVHDVLGSIGLDINDLFERRPDEGSPPTQRNRFPAADVLRALRYEITLVSVAASAIAQGEVLCESDRAALIESAGRIESSIQAAGISHG